MNPIDGFSSCRNQNSRLQSIQVINTNVKKKKIRNKFKPSNETNKENQTLQKGKKNKQKKIILQLVLYIGDEKVN
jgi:hypothetical protein